MNCWSAASGSFLEIPSYKGCALIRESSIKAITRVIKDAALACSPLSLCCLKERADEEGENAADDVNWGKPIFLGHSFLPGKDVEVQLIEIKPLLT